MQMMQGDVLKFAEQGRFDVVVQGCNCFCTMNSGIAGQIHRDYPEAYEVDCTTTVKGDKNKLGKISYVLTERNGVQFFIVNGYTQYNYGRTPGVYANYKAIRSVFKEVKQHFGHLRIAYPKIGCGLANGDWNIVSKIIEEELGNCDHTYVEFK
jgi:O-acetyl-ADP-ribose deacetylase (regulator of RNase III)